MVILIIYMLFLLSSSTIAAPLRASDGGEQTETGRKAQELKQIKELLSRKYDLKQKYVEGEKRYYRLWMTIESLDPYGKTAGRYQWRGDLERIVTSIDPSGRAEEKITWKNVGFRNWLMKDNKYGVHQQVPWAEGFSYRFSAEDDYRGLNWDYSQIPKSSLGFAFRGALQVSAHVEFDFLRSSRHAAIEKLMGVGQVMRNLPEEGQIFSLDLPPIFTNSRLERKDVQVGFLGLTLADNEPCALIDYRQGPQKFSWTSIPAAGGGRFNTDLISRQNGVFLVRLKDGSLLGGEFSELAISRATPEAGGSGTAGYTLGSWSIHEVSKDEFDEGLAGWAKEESPRPRFRPEVENKNKRVPIVVTSKRKGIGTEMTNQELKKLRELLSRDYNLKPRYVKDRRRFFRLWMTVENLDPFGKVAGRSQWRGDFERVVLSVTPPGRAEEKVTWKNVGLRSWLLNEGKYGVHQTVPWAEGFSYIFSAEEDYDQLDWDFSEIPKTMAGFTFRGALQISAHAEFDWLRSSKHAAIEKLTRVGEMMRDLPKEGHIFSLDLPPVVTNSRIEGKNTHLGFLGLTMMEAEPCAIIDYTQGPMPYSLMMAMGPDQPRVRNEMIARQNGRFNVRLKDGGLVQGEFTEIAFSKITPNGAESSTPGYMIATWSIREIGRQDFEEGLAQWGAEQTPIPRFRPER